MKKEAIITIIIIILISFGEWITQSHTNKQLGKIEEELQNLKKDILEEQMDSENLINKTNELYENWEKDNDYLSYYLEHDELEKVNTQIILIKGYLESDSPQDSIPDLEEGLYIIEHIKEKVAFKLKNIF